MQQVSDARVENFNSGSHPLNVPGVDSILREIEEKARKRRLPIIGPEKGRVIAGLIDEEKPTRALEVGTNIGYSGITIASHMPEGAVLYTMEIDEGLAAEAIKNVKRAGLAGRIKVLVGDARDLIPDLPGPLGFAFVDAEKVEYAEYLALMESKLRLGALVVADNAGIFEEDMSDYLDRVRNSGLYQSRYISMGWDDIEVSRWRDGA